MPFMEEDECIDQARGYYQLIYQAGDLRGSSGDK